MRNPVHLECMSLRYIINEEGQKEAVVLSIEEYNDLLEDLHDLALVAERSDERTIPHEEALSGLDG